MRFDEFSEKLRTIKSEYLKLHGKPLETIRDLEILLDKRIVKPKKTGLKSLKGLF